MQFFFLGHTKHFQAAFLSDRYENSGSRLRKSLIPSRDREKSTDETCVA